MGAPIKSIIIYPFCTGGTKQVADLLNKYLVQRGAVDVLELKDPDEAPNFFGRVMQAFSRKKAEIEPIGFDLWDYNIICIGTPVLADAPVPAINTYITRCFGVEGKTIVLFTIYGSGDDNQRCLDYMRGVFAKKGPARFKVFSIQQTRAIDEKSILDEIAEAVSL